MEVETMVGQDVCDEQVVVVVGLAPRRLDRVDQVDVTSLLHSDEGLLLYYMSLSGYYGLAI